MKIVQIVCNAVGDSYKMQLIALTDDGRIFTRTTTDNYASCRWTDWVEMAVPHGTRRTQKSRKTKPRTLKEWNSMGWMVRKGEKSTGRDAKGVPTFTPEQTVEAPGFDEDVPAQDEW